MTPNALPLKFHHLGLAVKSLSHAELLLNLQEYKKGTPVFDPLQNVNLCMFTHESEPSIEVIWPEKNQGPTHKLIQSHSSGIVYHICYQTHHLQKTLSLFSENGIELICISPPQPAVLFNGLRVSFYNIKGIGLVELLEEPQI